MHRSSCRPSASFIEPLESRTLLAADLAVLSASTTNLAAANGSKTGTLTIKNSGTVNMSGPVTVTFTAKTATGAAQTLGTKTVTLSGLKPNATLPVSGVSLKAPTGTGTFNITVKIAKAGDTVAANNSKAAGSVTLKSSGNTGGTGDGQAVFGIAGAGTTLKFKRTENSSSTHGIIAESGTFTDGAGHSGTYFLGLPPVFAVNTPGQLLTIDFDASGDFAGGRHSYRVTFTPASKRLGAGLNGKTVTFTKTAAGASAKLVVVSGSVGDIYMKY